MALVLTCSPSIQGAHPGLGKRQGRNHSATLLRLSSPSPWASRALRYAPRPISSKRIGSVSPRASAAAGMSNGADVQPIEPILSRQNFPEGFVFGAATSSYQIEGAWNVDGKKDSIWDHYCHTFPGRIDDWSNGDDAVHSYYLYPEDVKMLKAMGMDAYRFSISWPRILPNGTLNGGINQKGIDYYNKLIDLLLLNGIKPYVTLFHWETPQALEDDYRSFLSPKIVDDFRDYAEVCFKKFGDRVKHWFTFNEPYVFCTNAYGIGRHAPGRCSPDGNCALPIGNSLAEPYIAGHHLILAHAEAAQLYKSKYQNLQQGQIGMALVSMGYKPYNQTHFVDSQAQERSLDFNLGWFLEPMFRGDYPFEMRALVRDRLPYFTDYQKNRIIGTYDMLGLNYYTSRFSQSIDLSSNDSCRLKLNTDDTYVTPGVINAEGEYIGENTGTDWLYSCPEGLKNLLILMKEKYRNPPIYITENGIGDIDDGTQPMEHFLQDDTRLQYLKDHLAVLRDVTDPALGVNVRGHFTWSLLDNFEWGNGYTERFGLIYVDRSRSYQRTMKKSAKWFQLFNKGYPSAQPKGIQSTQSDEIYMGVPTMANGAPAISNGIAIKAM